MSQPAPQRRGALIVLVVLVFFGCLGLGWWQWDRFSAGGTYQNLGYALQWPLFAVVSVYAYRKFVRLESGAEEAAPRNPEPAELPADLLPPRPTARAADASPMSDYNAYLAALSEQDVRETRRNSR
ncbi:MAG: hypothetical protein ABI251_14460 [Mycobacteriaceae bacterium]